MGEHPQAYNNGEQNALYPYWLSRFKFVKCLKIQPDNAKALYRRGMAYLGNNNLLKAEEDLQKALSLAGNGKKIPVPTIICYFFFFN